MEDKANVHTFCLSVSFCQSAEYLNMLPVWRRSSPRSLFRAIKSSSESSPSSSSPLETSLPLGRPSMYWRMASEVFRRSDLNCLLIQYKILQFFPLFRQQMTKHRKIFLAK